VTPAAATRRELIETRLPLVRSIARRYATAGEPLEDLVQIGAIGLIKAVDRYDPARGVALDAYAVPAIAGEIRHHLRDRCDPLRVPRRLRADGVRVRAVSLDGIAGPVADPMDGAPERIALGTALRALQPRERRIVLLSFVADLSQAQIAARVGLSQVHVSRLLRAALANLRVQMLTTSTKGQIHSVAEEASRP
jgi:RNA polymerase sigma-B factor